MAVGSRSRLIWAAGSNRRRYSNEQFHSPPEISRATAVIPMPRRGYFRHFMCWPMTCCSRLARGCTRGTTGQEYRWRQRLDLKTVGRWYHSREAQQRAALLLLSAEGVGRSTPPPPTTRPQAAPLRPHALHPWPTPRRPARRLHQVLYFISSFVV